jgi:hypothetical protein
VQHPRDQRLRPGVAEKLEQLRADGVMMAIASNQGGCAEFEVRAKDIKPGMRLYDDLYPDGFEVLSVNPSGERLTQIEFDSEGLPDIRFEPNNRVFKVFYKSINSAIEEMEIGLRLTGIRTGLFCPDSQGLQVVCIRQTIDGSRCQRRDYIERNLKSKFKDFRKPGGGMLLALQYFMSKKDEPVDLLMVGDRPEDQQAAAAAGLAFEWAADFFG